MAPVFKTHKQHKKYKFARSLKQIHNQPFAGATQILNKSNASELPKYKYDRV